MGLNATGGEAVATQLVPAVHPAGKNAAAGSVTDVIGVDVAVGVAVCALAL
jgi:hypothetical protein